MGLLTLDGGSLNVTTDLAMGSAARTSLEVAVQSYIAAKFNSALGMGLNISTSDVTIAALREGSVLVDYYVPVPEARLSEMAPLVASVNTALGSSAIRIETAQTNFTVKQWVSRDASLPPIPSIAFTQLMPPRPPLNSRACSMAPEQASAIRVSRTAIRAAATHGDCCALPSAAAPLYGAQAALRPLPGTVGQPAMISSRQWAFPC